jgi:hypothetical protein
MAVLPAPPHIDQARHVAADLVAGLGLADRALQDLVDQAERPRGQLFGALVQPVVELVGRQLPGARSPAASKGPSKT